MDIASRRRELEAWLILLRTPGLGPAALRALLARHGEARAALAAARRGELERPLDAPGRDWLRAPDGAVVAADLAWLALPDHALVTCSDADFPALLAEAPAPPAALFVAGDAGALWQPQVAIVGSRNASQGGAATAAGFARALAGAGFAITSGLAEGIDGAAHAAALDAGGITLAVLGTGPNRVYPPKHHALAARVAAQGALVSEFPPGTPGLPAHFPRRNRIIAGLSLGTLVVEAGLRSGALITAADATEAGREVFAIPGSIHNPLARGCHALIRSGAKLVETAEEVVTELAPLARRLGVSLRERLNESNQHSFAVENDTAASRRARDPDYARLFAALGHDPLGIDQLAERSGLAVPALASMLLMLELEGDVVARQGGYALKVQE
jgi:DNA processing protein